MVIFKVLRLLRLKKHAMDKVQNKVLVISQS
jgi:hypothetical protein